jgi:hypothetical protein
MGIELVLARRVLIRRVGQTTVPAVYVATRLISRLRQRWRVCLDEMSDDRITLSVWADGSYRLALIDTEIRASFAAETNPGWELELV